VSLILLTPRFHYITVNLVTKIVKAAAIWLLLLFGEPYKGCPSGKGPGYGYGKNAKNVK